MTVLPVTAMVVGVDDVPLGDEFGDEVRVAPRVLADPVQELHDGTRLRRRRVVVEDDADTVSVGERAFGRGAV